METYCDTIRRATEEDLSRIAEILVFVKRIKYRPIFNSRHPDPNDPDMTEENDGQFPEGMFRFEKIMF